eukprot:10182317-Prorocentrum_lima.AAC.1
MTSSLVGSEMCIRDSPNTLQWGAPGEVLEGEAEVSIIPDDALPDESHEAVSYTHLTLPTICSV